VAAAGSALRDDVVTAGSASALLLGWRRVRVVDFAMWLLRE
jgi:hypothetical protein